ncbi:MAG: hypothetical protein KC996_09205 [Phycisphaerales bacterium]|nr:hypothetical protein [Phycisphaerales bacterium]
MSMNNSAYALRFTPLLFRLGVAVLVITLLGGYIVSGLHLRWHYENRDEVPGLSMNDIIGAYHGVQSPSPLVEALESGHPETLSGAEREALLGWLSGGNLSGDYDNLDLGEDAPAEIIAVNCLECHTRGATGEGAMPGVPLEYFDEIERIAYSKDIQPAGENIVAMSQHAHAPTMAVILLVIGALTLTTRFTARFVGFVLFVAAFGLFVDMAGWWITREVAWFAHAIVIGGIAYAMGTSLLGALVVLDCVIPAKRCPADG